MKKELAALTIDIGLTNCKAALFDIYGQLITHESQRYPTLQNHVKWSEQDPNEWWKATRQSVHRLMASTAIAKVEIIAISFTAHMHGLVAVDGSGRTLTNCLTLFDRRSDVEAKKINQTLGHNKAYEITGGRLESYTPAAKILWLKRNQPEIFKRTAKFLSAKDVIRMQFGGEWVTDPIDAAGMLLYDLHKKTWSEDILEVIGLNTNQLPEVRASAESAGFLSEVAAEELGLRPGIPLITGAGDDVEALGAGVVHPGQTLEHIGTAGTVISCTQDLVFDPEQLIEIYPHAIQDCYLVGGATNAAGKSLDWASGLLSIPECAESVLPLSYPFPNNTIELPIYLPYISGERGILWEANATGAFLGLREQHTARDITNSVYQGVVFSLKDVLMAVEVLGIKPTVIVSGAPPEQREWAQLRADAYGYPILFPASSYPTGLGAAMLAFLNQKVYVSLMEVVQQSCRIEQQVDPDPAMKKYFDKRFEVYRKAVQTCRTLFSDLA